MGVIDVILLLLLVAAFFLGFFQGGVRMLVVLLAWLAAFLLAANLRGALGGFLGGYWTQFSAQYTRMLAFAILFLVLFVVAIVGIQIAYRRPPALSRFPMLDEVAGGIAGVAVGLLVIAALVVILDSFYTTGSPVGQGQVGIVADAHRTLSGSAVANALRTGLLPILAVLLGPLLPAEISAVMR